MYPYEDVRSPSAIAIASIVAMFIVFTRLFRHLLNSNGLRIIQITAMINLKTKFEGSLNRPCAKHNEVQRYHEEFVSDRASCLQANSHGNWYP